MLFHAVYLRSVLLVLFFLLKLFNLKVQFKLLEIEKWEVFDFV